MKRGKKTYVKAFTVLELLVGMAVMSILLAMIYVTFNFFSNQVYTYQIENEEIQELNRFDTALKRDMFKAQSIEKKQEGFLLKMYKGDSIRYTFKETYTLRENQIRRDTFQLSGKGVEINIPFLVSDSLVQFRGTYYLMGEKIESHFIKTPGIAQRINRRFKP